MMVLQYYHIDKVVYCILYSIFYCASGNHIVRDCVSYFGSLTLHSVLGLCDMAVDSIRSSEVLTGLILKALKKEGFSVDSTLRVVLSPTLCSTSDASPTL